VRRRCVLQDDAKVAREFRRSRPATPGGCQSAPDFLRAQGSSNVVNTGRENQNRVGSYLLLPTLALDDVHLALNGE